MNPNLLNDTYEIREEIGSGGGGTVYKAYHKRLRNYVVVKKIKEEVKGKIENRAEVDILKNLKHTYLPQVYDFLEIDGEIYTVMDLVPGKSLSEEIKSGRKFTQKEVVKWGTQLCEVLDYLHSQEPPIIHSDIKPANIMLTPDGNISLIDFNISMALDPNMKATIGISKGYSPPEQYGDQKTYLDSVSEYYRRQKFQTIHERQDKSENQDEQARQELQGKSTEQENQTELITELDADQTELLTELDSGQATELLEIEAFKDEVGNEETELQVEPVSFAHKRTSELVSNIVGRGIDKRSDIYSLSATLYHLISEIQPDSVYEEIVPIDKLKLPISDALEHIIAKGMNFDPALRYQDAGQMLSDFKNIRQLDKRYKDYQRKRKLATIGFLAGCVLFAAVTAYGYTELVRERNNDFATYIGAANVSILSGELYEAERNILLAREIFPERIDSFVEELHMIYRRGDFEEVIRYGRQLINAPPYRINNERDARLQGDLFFIVGNAYIASENFMNAILYFRSAIERNAGNPEYYRDYAIALAKTGQVDAAVDTLALAILKGLGVDGIYLVQGEIALARGNVASAEQYLNSAIRAAQSDTLRYQAFILLAQMYRGIATYEAVVNEIATLRQAEAVLSGRNPFIITEMLGDAHFRKARLVSHDNMQYLNTALEYFERLYISGFATLNVMQNIALIHIEMENFAEASAMLYLAKDRHPDNYRIYKRLAFMEISRQQLISNEHRNYRQFAEYYERATSLYRAMPARSAADLEMQMLEVMMRDVRAGGWL